MGFGEMGFGESGFGESGRHLSGGLCASVLSCSKTAHWNQKCRKCLLVAYACNDFLRVSLFLTSSL